MNIGFLIDNSMTMNQRGYNGLTLLEIAKSYVQKAIQNKNYLRLISNEYSACHLFASSSLTPLSSYQNQQLHFTNQLKYIQAQPITQLADTLKEAFKVFDKYRVMNGCETVVGNIQPFSRGSNLLIILTDSCDFYTLETICFRIKNGLLKTQYDYQVCIMRICPPSYYDKPSYEGIRKCVELDRSTEMMKQIAEHWNGKFYQIHRYQYGFEVMDTIINYYVPKISIKMQVIQKTPAIPFFRQSGISGVEKTSESPFLLKNQFNISSIKPPIVRRTRIPLPVYPPSLKINNLTNIAQIENSYAPSYILDISKAFDFPMSQIMPFQKLQLQSSLLSSILNQKIQKLRIQKIYIPVYFTYDQRSALFGLLKVVFNKPLELLFYFANFIQFNSILQFMLEKKSYDRIANSSFEATVQQYIRKIPPIYDFYISQYIASQRSNVNIRSRVPELLIKYNEQIEKIQYKQRRIDCQKCLESSKMHQRYQSECCAVFSKFYEKWSRDHQSDHSEDKYTKDITKTIERALELKSLLLPFIDDDIHLEKVKLKPVTLQLSNYTVKAGNQNEPLGNPYKKKKKLDEINITIDNPPMQIEQPKPFIPQKPPIISPPMIQVVHIEKQKQPQQDTQSKSKEHVPRPDKPEQILVNNISSLFKINKPVKLKISLENIVMEDYQNNNRILGENNI